MIEKESPESYRKIAKECKMSLRSVYKTIHDDLKKMKRVKQRVHRLTDAHKRNRKTNCRKLYENVLCGGKSEFVVSLDEAFVYLDDCNRKRRICYVKIGEDIPQE